MIFIFWKESQIFLTPRDCIPPSFDLVDSEDISIVGFCVYGGPGTNRYEAEISNKQINLFQKLNGSLTANDGIFTVKFEKAILLKIHSKYTLKWKNSEKTIGYGANGIPIITGPDGTKFKYEADPTNPNSIIESGQLFQILYFKGERKILQVFMTIIN